MHNLVLGFLNIGSSEMILIVFVALLLFGGEKLPEIARGLGKGIRDFKDASDGVKREINNQINNYEEKREEDKQVERAIIEQQEAAKKLLPEHNTGFTPVENTMPVSDNFAADGHPQPGAPAVSHDEPAAEDHALAAHQETETSGTTKNT